MLGRGGWLVRAEGRVCPCYCPMPRTHPKSGILKGNALKPPEAGVCMRRSDPARHSAASGVTHSVRPWQTSG
ncbi:hypothetical protein JCM16814_16860 [Desulfobaculum senezii]